MSFSIKQKAAGATFWTLIDSLGGQIVQFSFSIILARLLSPDDYGLIAMLAVFTVISSVLIQFGFNYALFQKKEISEADKSTVFWLNFLLGLIVSIVLCLLSPFIVLFYGKPELLKLTYVFSATIFLSSFQLVPTTLFNRDLTVKPIAKSTIYSQLIAGISGIYFALTGWGVWALAVQNVVCVGLKTVMIWCYSPWSPQIIFSMESCKVLWPNSWKMLLNGISNALFGNIYYIVIGRCFNAASLGYYSRADSFQRMMSYGISGIISRVTFPILVAHQNDPQILRRYMSVSVKMVAFIVCPVMLGIIAVADSMINVVLGEKWQSSIFPLRILSISGILYPLHLLDINFLLAIGRAGRVFVLEWVKRPLIIIAVILAIYYGINALLYSTVVISILCLFVNSYYPAKFVSYNWIDHLKDFMPYLFISSIMSLVVYYAGTKMGSGVMQLIVQLALGVIVYLVMCYIFKPYAYREVVAYTMKLYNDRYKK